MELGIVKPGHITCQCEMKTFLGQMWLHLYTHTECPQCLCSGACVKSGKRNRYNICDDVTVRMLLLKQSSVLFIEFKSPTLP